jgi:ribose transport system substrate-binding protein
MPGEFSREAGEDRGPRRGMRAWLLPAVALLGLLALHPLAMADENQTALDQARLTVPPSYQGPTTPAKAPPDIKIGVVVCFSVLHGCVSPGNGVADAAKKLGWTVTLYNGGGTASKQNAAILDAVSSKVNAIVAIGVEPSLVQLGLHAAKEAGIPVISASAGIDTPNPVRKSGANELGYAFDIGTDYAALGRSIGQWIVAESGGDANIVVYSDKEFPAVIALEPGLFGVLHACSGCTTGPTQYFSATQIGTTLGQQTVGYLRSHPQVNYIFSPYDPAAAVQVTAILQAGLGKRVKLVSVLGDQQNLDFIRRGLVQVADGSLDNEYAGYAIVDQIIRLLTSKPLVEPHGEYVPAAVLDQTNLTPPGADWHAPYEYKSNFEKLWQ